MLEEAKQLFPFKEPKHFLKIEKYIHIYLRMKSERFIKNVCIKAFKKADYTNKKLN